jgi:hypothetical protein
MRVLLIFLLITFVNLSKAQVNEDEFTPKSGSIFNLEKNKVKKTGYDGYNHAVKWSPFMITRGLTGLNYEYKPFENVSFGMGTGIDLFEDVVSVYSEGYLLTSNTNYIDLYDVVDGNERKSNIALYLNPSITFYYESLWSYNDAFMKLDYRFRSKKYLYNYAGDDLYPDEVFDIRLTQHTFSIINGLHFNGGNRIKVIHELYWGFGVNVFKNSDLDLVEVEENGFIVNKLGVSENKATHFGMSFLLGYTFGIGW